MSPRPAKLVLPGALLVAVLASCAGATTQAQPPAAAGRQIDRLAQDAKRRWDNQIHGRAVHAKLQRLSGDATLRRILTSGNVGALRAYVDRTYPRVWYHWHVSRMRVVRGSRLFADAGVPFCVAPGQMTLRGAHGRYLGTLQVSIQDVIGYVRLMHRNYPMDVVVRGRGAAHVKTSLGHENSGLVRYARLPNSGRTTVAGGHYNVRSFTATALGGEPVKVWILQHA
jgi:hypothetical protein